MAEDTKTPPTAPDEPQRWIRDSFDGCVWVHDVVDTPGMVGRSVKLEAGDAVPAGVELVGIPTTDRKPRSARLRDFDRSDAADDDDEDDEDAARFDPRGHAVRDVTAYLQEHPEDRQRVLNLERRGGNRPGVLGRAQG